MVWRIRFRRRRGSTEKKPEKGHRDCKSPHDRFSASLTTGFAPANQPDRRQGYLLLQANDYDTEQIFCQDVDAVGILSREAPVGTLTTTERKRMLDGRTRDRRAQNESSDYEHPPL
jgi:hypothetical protein